MNCEKSLTLIDDYIDRHLDDEARSSLEDHLSSCPACREVLAGRQELIQELRALPVPPMHPAFVGNALRNARHRGSQRRNFAAGFITAIAATLVIWLSFGTMHSIQEPAPGINTLKQVALQVEQPRTISLAFNSPNALEQVSFRLELPDGVELVNHPRQRQLSWQDQLQKGRNVLQLKLVGKYHSQGILTASIEHGGKTKVFHIPLSVASGGAELSPEAAGLQPIV